MKKAFFLFGLIILFFSSLVWVSSGDNSVFRISASEFITMLGISLILMIFEIISQVKKFFNSGRNDVPF